jgi:transcriptional regulator with GAF, ATPase, and Fis domain
LDNSGDHEGYQRDCCKEKIYQKYFENPPEADKPRLRRTSHACGEQVSGEAQKIKLFPDTEDQMESLQNRLDTENPYPPGNIRLNDEFEEIIGTSDVFKKVLHRVRQVALTDTTVLIFGESGTGKELIARAIHNISPRRKGSLVTINCAALPVTLIESELFGHQKGAFTGACSCRVGRFELAHNGTIFLDEIGDLPLELQAKLLRILQLGEFERIGGTRSIKVNVRIIAATNQNLKKAIINGQFREDLYYRLDVFPIWLPPLRERKEDIQLLVRYFVKKYSTRLGKEIDMIPQKLMDNFQNYTWPGNVRELQNLIERSVILSQGNVLQARPFTMSNGPTSCVFSKIQNGSSKANAVRHFNWA